METSLFVALLCLALSWAEFTNYNGHKVYRLKGIKKENREFLENVFHLYDVDVWASSQKWVDVRLSPHEADDWVTLLQSEQITADVHIEDVQRLINEQLEIMKSKVPKSSLNFTEYNTFEDIEFYLQELAANDSRVTLQSIGQTFEGRSLHLVAIATGGVKPSVWFDCGIHAREWITPATCLWGLDYLTTGYGVDPDVTALLDNYDVYMVPVQNPDGYTFSWDVDRLWRKNRVDYPENSCRGVDLNRNYDDGHWGGVGASNLSCAYNYHGPTPFSERESSAIRDTVTSLMSSASLTLFFSIHSYAQKWMYPYGWTDEQVPPEELILANISRTGVEALVAVHGTPYEYGPLGPTLYVHAGTAIDWAYFTGILHSYTLELRDQGQYGFLLPEDQIQPTAEETWAGLLAAILSV